MTDIERAHLLTAVEIGFTDEPVPDLEECPTCGMTPCVCQPAEDPSCPECGDWPCTCPGRHKYHCEEIA